jgi:hypothetical protein
MEEFLSLSLLSRYFKQIELSYRRLFVIIENQDELLRIYGQRIAELEKAQNKTDIKQD